MPAVSDPLAQAFAQTDYAVRLPAGGRALLRVGSAPPPPLRELIGSAAWAFVTAWHPHARQAPRSDNRAAQRRLLDDLRHLPNLSCARAGIGIGRGGWREPSLFVVGPHRGQFDTLMQRYLQRAYLEGEAGSVARLRWL